MKSKMITEITIAFIVALSIVAGLRAQQPGSGTLTFKTIFTFNNPFGGPSAALVQGTDGNLYGTTADGGPEYEGTVFRITPQGQLATLHSFDGTDGTSPQTPLVLGTDGNFYGTTFVGGPLNLRDCGGEGCGTVFKITPGGALTTLYSFCEQEGCPDGARPGGLVQGSDGNFYGTTPNTCFNESGTCSDVSGTVFKITPNGVLTTLYEFTATGDNPPDPSPSLVQGTDGNFYGTTGGGGSGCLGSGCGTVFKITPQGELTTLYNFTGGANGYGPGGLVQAADGNFYGPTGRGGSNQSQNCQPFGCGTVYKITPQGALTTLTNLNVTVGTGPSAFIQATDGNFYATAVQGGGPCDCGSVFEVTPEGALTRLHGFNHSGGGYLPFGALFQGTNGGFYGDTFYSTPGYGAVFALSTGLGPFVSSVPTRGKAGIPVKILGNNLTGATSVTFNGVAAAFTVESSTYIEATVPAGATTGPVEVTLPGGTLTSNVPFRVTP